MSNENMLIAREIFMKYGGNPFHMDREGEYDYYKSFNISKEQEQLWINEYQQEMLSKIEVEGIESPSFIKLVFSIRDFKNIIFFEGLIDLVKMKKSNLDTFSQMRMAEGILEIVESFCKNKEIMIQNTNIIDNAKHLAIEILNDIIKKPITVASYYKNVGYLNDVIQEDKIVNRIQSLIEKWKK